MAHIMPVSCQSRVLSQISHRGRHSPLSREHGGANFENISEKYVGKKPLSPRGSRLELNEAAPTHAEIPATLQIPPSSTYSTIYSHTSVVVTK